MKGDRLSENTEQQSPVPCRTREPQREPSIPGAYALAGPGGRRDDEGDDDDDSDTSIISDGGDSREDCENQEDPVMIRATLVVEEEEGDTTRASVDEDTIRRSPPLAHAEPWNIFMSNAMAAARVSGEMEKKFVQKDETSSIASSKQSRYSLRTGGFCLLFIIALIGGGGLAWIQWIKPQRSEDNSSDNNLDEIALGDDWDENGMTNSPTMAPTLQEPLLRNKEQFSHYVVQWGIQTEGCQSAILPKLELSCKSPNSVVHVIEPKNGSSDNENERNDWPPVDCERLGDNHMECRMQDEGNLDSTATQNDFYGKVVVVCAVDEDLGQPGAQSLDLEANIPIGVYGKNCNELQVAEEYDQDEQFMERTWGGEASLWLTLGRVCPTPVEEASFSKALRENRQQKHENNSPRSKNLRQGNNDDGLFNLNITALLRLNSEMLCEQGSRTNIENTDHEICFQYDYCGHVQLCSKDDFDCSQALCDVASRAVVGSDMLGLFNSDAGNYGKCWFENLLPRRWLFIIADTVSAPSSEILVIEGDNR